MWSNSDEENMSRAAEFMCAQGYIGRSFYMYTAQLKCLRNFFLAPSTLTTCLYTPLLHFCCIKVNAITRVTKSKLERITRQPRTE